jgi:hypothetical protein
MKVYDLLDKEGRLFAFELNNFFISRRRICAIVRQIPGVRIIRTVEPLSKEDEFCEFEVDGCLFLVWEPWGDSNRFWIGPKSKEWAPQVKIVRDFLVFHKRFF